MGWESIILHTGQHYDSCMSDIFFEHLRLPEPAIYLGIGSDSQARQTARIMIAFEEALLERDPDLLVVVGDVNSTLACSLVAAKLRVPVAHIEAGLRSGDMGMPEEINRILTDRLSRDLFVTEESAVTNLLREGVGEERIHFVGNLMIDTLVNLIDEARESPILDRLGLQPKQYLLMTIHRPSNVDGPMELSRIIEVIEKTAETLPVVFPIHPRTVERLHKYDMMDRLDTVASLVRTEPLGYLEFLHLMEEACVVVTDSGGIQEETTYLQIPCLTLRENTERPVTITMGTNELMPLDPVLVVRRVVEIVTGDPWRSEGRRPPLWDGKAAERVVKILEQRL